MIRVSGEFIKKGRKLGIIREIIPVATTARRAQLAIKALRDPDDSLASVCNTVRQSIADTIEDSSKDIDRLRSALANFADQKNWHSEAGLLQWIGKRNAIEFAQSVLDGE